MITAGIDMGAKTIKVVVLREGEVIGKAIRVGGFDATAAAREAKMDRKHLYDLARKHGLRG